MDIFVAIIEDRHCDVTVKPFTKESKAVEWAKTQALEYCRYPEDYKVRLGQWCFYAEYSCEGDSVRVVKCELNE